VLDETVLDEKVTLETEGIQPPPAPWALSDIPLPVLDETVLDEKVTLETEGELP
jgi:hypothetical protein